MKRILSASLAPMFLRNRIMKLQYCVYVLISLSDKKLYIGSTSNLKQRLTDHFHGNAQSTAGRRPFKLIFCEYFIAKSDALRREKYFKTTVGKRALKLVARDSMSYYNTKPL